MSKEQVEIAIPSTFRSLSLALPGGDARRPEGVNPSQISRNPFASRGGTRPPRMHRRNGGSRSTSASEMATVKEMDNDCDS